MKECLAFAAGLTPEKKAKLDFLLTVFESISVNHRYDGLTKYVRQPVQPEGKYQHVGRNTVYLPSHIRISESN